MRKGKILPTVFIRSMLPFIDTNDKIVDIFF